MFQKRIDADGIIRGHDPPLGCIAVDLLDPAFGVATVAAHVPLAMSARTAWLGIGPTDDADDQVTRIKPAIRRRRDHLPQGLMTDHQPVSSGRSPPVGT